MLTDQQKKDLGNLFSSNKPAIIEEKPPKEARVEFADAFNNWIDKNIVDKSKERYAIGRGKGSDDVSYYRIGAAYAGTKCLRELAYRYFKISPDIDGIDYKAKGRLQRHADYGHHTEELIIQWLRDSGFEVLDKKEDGSQYGYKSGFDKSNKARFAGELDGVIVKSPIPDIIPDNINLECKKCTDKKYQNFVRNGVKATEEKYYAQCQLGMAYTQREYCLLLAVNLDTMEIYPELIPFNLADAQYYNDRVAQVLKSSCAEDMPKSALARDAFVCMFCDYKNNCFGRE